MSLIHRKAYSRAAELARGREVLDLGCNNGAGTALIAQAARRVRGVDVSPRAIASARRKYRSSGIEFHRVDGAAPQFPDRSFDMVTSFQVIEHVLDVAAYLAEVRRVLRPAGIALLTTPNRVIRLDPGMKPWNRFHVTEYTASGLIPTFGTLGFGLR